MKPSRSKLVLWNASTGMRVYFYCEAKTISSKIERDPRRSSGMLVLRGDLVYGLGMCLVLMIYVTSSVNLQYLLEMILLSPSAFTSHCRFTLLLFLSSRTLIAHADGINHKKKPPKLLNNSKVPWQEEESCLSGGMSLLC